MMPKPEPTFVRTALEVARAHDLCKLLLHLVVVGKVDENRLTMAQLDDCMAYHRVLCWLLGNAGAEFPDHLEIIQQELERRGVDIADLEKMQRAMGKIGHAIRSNGRADS